MGITNQRETLCAYEPGTLKPAARAIVWQCKRSALICDAIKKEGHEPGIREKTGLFVDPYFTGSKIRWLIENRPELASKIAMGKLRLGTMDNFLVSKFGGGKDHVTEASNASRTLLYNIHTGAWDDDLLAIMGLKSSACLPELRDSVGVFTKTKGLGFLPDHIPITGVLGDQQAALAGQRCFSIGEGKCTYGTGAFLLLNIGPQPLPSRNKLLTTVAWQIGGKRTYALEGSAFIAGAALQFLRDNLGFLKNAADSENLARDVTAAPNLYFVPALAGLGAPWWEPRARGAFLGLTRATKKEQLVRASLEGVAFQVADLMEAMKMDCGGDFKVLRVDGGAAANALLLELQAKISGVSIQRPHVLETTAMGAVLFAGLGAKRFASILDLKGRTISVHSQYEPPQSKHDLEKLEEQRAGWKRAIKAVQVFSAGSEK